jgi:hypothetical protein
VKLPCSDGVPSGGKFPYQLGENFTRDQHGNTDERDICRRNQQFEVETTPINGSRKTNVIANAFTER